MCNSEIHVYSKSLTLVGGPYTMAGTWIAAPYLEQHHDPAAGPKKANGCLRVTTNPVLRINPQEERIGDLIASYV